MKTLKFKRLILVSTSQKSANQFEFSERFNLITSDQNNVGKSTFVKSLLWVFGCEPDFDENWSTFNYQALLEFSIDKVNYTIARIGDNRIWVSDNSQNSKEFSKITGAYSEYFSELVNFPLLLPNKKTPTNIETPPPAYYFSAFYVDQLKWFAPYDGFKNMWQFSNWKSPVIKTLTGYFGKTYFEIAKDIAESKFKANQIVETIKEMSTTQQFIHKFVPPIQATVSPNELNEMTIEVQDELNDLLQKQEEIFPALNKLQDQNHSLTSQINIINQAIKNLESDYIFSVERIDNDILECPTCGTHHDNSLLSRTSILADKERLIFVNNELNSELVSVRSNIGHYNSELSITSTKINQINNKYEQLGSSTQHEISRLASKEILNTIETEKAIKHEEKNRYEVTQKTLIKEQNKLLDRKKKAELNDNFVSYLQETSNEVNPNILSFSKIKSATDFNKVNIGGAAYKLLQYLSYYLAVYKQISTSSEVTLAPLLLDSPNQQEQAEYDKLISAIMNKTPSFSQIFVCGMENSALKEFEKEAKVIFIKPENFLQQSLFESLYKEIQDFCKSSK